MRDNSKIFNKIWYFALLLFVVMPAVEMLLQTSWKRTDPQV